MSGLVGLRSWFRIDSVCGVRGPLEQRTGRAILELGLRFRRRGYVRWSIDPKICVS